MENKQKNKQKTKSKTSNNKLHNPSKNGTISKVSTLKNDKNNLLLEQKVNNEPTIDDKNKIESKNKKTKSLVVSKSKKDVNSNKSKTKALVLKKKQSEKEREILAIEKYKDIPLNQLYKDLDDMRAYVNVLNERRNELLSAKAHLDPKVRKIAIQKTIDNTFMIQFKYQDAVFRNHFQPSGLQIINESQLNNTQHGFGDRSMHRSTERTISDVTNVTINQNILNNDIFKQHAGMENREARTIGSNSSVVPGVMTEQRSVNVEGMQNRQVPIINPPLGIQPGLPPNIAQTQQQIIQQTTTEQQLIEGTIQPIRVIDKPVVVSKKARLDVWPLYEKILFLISNRKQPKVLLIFLIIFSVLSVLVIIFFVLWGFAVDWTEWTTIDIGEAFRNLFNPLS